MMVICIAARFRREEFYIATVTKLSFGQQAINARLVT
jgi:hypothetical protein